MSGASACPTALLQQALDIYRHPLLYRKLWSDPGYPLPEGIGELLDLALAAPEALDAQAARLYASRDELAAAVHFFIHQVLLAEENDAYRMLGLTPGATPAQAKSHYRKLMSLYHPDRGAGNEWNEIYAPRINRAYSALRGHEAEPARGAAPRTGQDSWGYQQAGPAAGEAFRQHHPFGETRSGQHAVGRGLLGGLKSLLAPRPPSRRGCGAIASTAAVAAGVGFILWNLLEWPAAQEWPGLQSTAASSPAKSPAGQVPGRSEKPAPADYDQRISAGREAYGPARPTAPPAGVRASPAMAAGMPVIIQPDRYRVREAERRLAAASMPPVLPPLTLVAPTPLGLSEHELKIRVLDRLAAAYRQGDVNALLALFSEQAVTNSQSGREGIRSEYTRLFADTTQRELRLGSFHWQIDDQIAMGKGTFNLQVETVEQDMHSSREGTLIIDVGQSPKGPLINGFFEQYRETP